MKNKKRLVFVVVSLIVGFSLFDRELLYSVISGKIIQLITPHGAYVSYKQSQLSLWGIDLFDVAITPPKIGIQLQSVKTRCSFMSLITLSPECETTINAYNGVGLLHSTFSKLSDPQIKGSIDNLELAAHPYLQAIGIESGTVSISNIIVGPNPESFSFDISALNIKKPIGSKISQKILGLPTSLELPSLTLSLFKAKFSKTSSALNIDKVKIESTLGDASGSASFDKILPKNLDLNLKLSETGLLILKNYLQFICPAELLSPKAPIRISLSSSNLSRITCLPDKDG